MCLVTYDQTYGRIWNRQQQRRVAVIISQLNRLQHRGGGDSREFFRREISALGARHTGSKVYTLIYRFSKERLLKWAFVLNLKLVFVMTMTATCSTQSVVWSMAGIAAAWVNGPFHGAVVLGWFTLVLLTRAAQGNGTRESISTWYDTERQPFTADRWCLDQICMIEINFLKLGLWTTN